MAISSCSWRWRGNWFDLSFGLASQRSRLTSALVRVRDPSRTSRESPKKGQQGILRIERLTREQPMKDGVLLCKLCYQLTASNRSSRPAKVA